MFRVRGRGFRVWGERGYKAFSAKALGFTRNFKPSQASQFCKKWRGGLETGRSVSCCSI